MQLIDAQGAGDILNLRIKQVYMLAKQGIVPAVRVGRLLRFDPVALRRWIAEGGQGFEAGWKRQPNESRDPATRAGESGSEVEADQ